MPLVSLPPVLTVAQTQNVFASVVPSKMTSQYRNLRLAAQELFDTFWNHPVLTPQQAFDVLGTDGAKAVQIAVATKTYIETIEAINGITSDPNFLTPTQNVTVDGNGFVTIG